MIDTIPETINEIQYRKIDRKCCHNLGLRIVTNNKYRRNDRVVFNFFGLIRRGRISNCFCDNGICTYHIETDDGVWYREIPEHDIISKQNGH